MQILLDECLPKKLKNYFEGHQVLTVPQAGLAGVKNGELLKSISLSAYDIFITVDQNLVYQQKIKGLSFGIIILQAYSNRLEDLLPVVPKLIEAIEIIQPGDCIEVG